MAVIKIALIQMQIAHSKDVNLLKAGELVKQAAADGAQVAVLPEMFNCPYSTVNFPLYAEKAKEKSWQQLSKMAQHNDLYLIGGSIPEIDEQGKIYNTCYVFDNTGKQIAKHRKMHLFDIDVQGGQYFKESDTLTAGDTATVFDTAFGRLGVMICYDIRFPELARSMVKQGAQIIFVPGAFNMTTGPAHWEILFRTRALDNQVYTVGVAPARDPQAEYISYGNSIIADPWGRIANRLGFDESVLIQEIDMQQIQKIREELPLLKHLRAEIY